MANVNVAVMPDIIKPTYVGFLRTTRDVCLLMEMTLSGSLAHIPRRPHERERSEIIKSGHIFIYEESTSGIKRWTDGMNWSPSRILGNFLIYREVDASYPPEGGKKVALKKARAAPGSKPTGVQKKPVPATPYYGYSINNASAASTGTYSPGENELANLEDRELYGSLTDSYPFIEKGLIKKTITVAVNGVQHHVVSYYRPDHVRSGELKTPSMDSMFAGITPRDSLLRSSVFRVPIETEEYKINVNSDHYITPERAHAQGLYPPHAPQHQQLYQSRPVSLNNHGLPDHGLPSAGMASMSTYRQPASNLPTHAPSMQTPSPFPDYLSAPLSSSLQHLAQNGMEAIGTGHFPSAPSHGFTSAEQDAYSFPGAPSRQPPHVSIQTNAYNQGQNDVYAAPHEASYGPTPNSYTPAHNHSSNNNIAFAPTAAPDYAAPRDYRQPSVASAQHSYMQLAPGTNLPNPSPSHREIQGLAGLQGDTKPGSVDWNTDYNNITGQFLRDTSHWQ